MKRNENPRKTENTKKNETKVIFEIINASFELAARKGEHPLENSCNCISVGCCKGFVPLRNLSPFFIRTFACLIWHTKEWTDKSGVLGAALLKYSLSKTWTVSAEIYQPRLVS